MPQVRLEIDASGAVTGIKQYSRATAEGEKATDKLTGSTKKAGNAVDKMGEKLVKQAAAVVSVAVAFQQIGKSLNIFAEFDDKLRVAASYAGATTEEFDKMGRAAARAGATTSKTASDAAQGLAEFASRGFTVQEQLEALVPAIRLAEAAQVSIGRATEVSAGILRGYGKEVSELERINDIIVGISGASAANLNFVGEAAKNAIPAARAVGEEFETVAAILGVLADQQFEAGQSGNALKNFMIALTGPTGRAQAALDKLGVSTRDAQGNFLGLVPIFKKLNAANLNLTESTEIFGRYFTTAALAVTKSIGEVESDLDLLKNGIDGITESTAEFQQAGLGGSFRKLGSAVEAVYIAVGGQLAPIVEATTGLLTEFAGNANKAATATTLFAGAARLLANSLLVIKGFASGVNTVFGAIGKVVGEASGAVANAAESVGKKFDLDYDKEAIDRVKNFQKFTDDFYRSQADGVKNTGKQMVELNKLFDQFDIDRKRNLSTTKQTEAAERALTAASESAATAAGKQAIAAGKSIEAALQAAEAARKAYLVTVEAANKQEAADKKSAATAEKKRIALEKQAKTRKKNALSYGATEAAAQKAADKVLEAGEAADSITGKGPDNLNKSLDQTVKKAGESQTALANIGNVGLPSGGGEISYSVGLSTGDYDRKVTYLKESVRSLNNDYQVKINFDTEGAEKLKKELDSTRKELEDTQAIKGYNEQLRGLQSEYGKVHQFLLNRKLEIVTDRSAEENLRGQINAVNDLKFSVDGVIPGLERVDGVWKQIPQSVNAAVQPALAGLGQFANAAGKIETTWKNIDGVWTEVLPNGTALVGDMVVALSDGEIAANNLGQAVAGAAQAATGEISPVEKALQKVEDQIKKTQSAAGSLKFDQLATQTGAFNAVTNEIRDLRKSLEEIDPASAEAEAGIKRLLSLEAIKSQLSKNISGLKKEIYETGEEAKKTRKAIETIPAAANAAAKSISNLADANGKVAKTIDELRKSVNKMGVEAKKTYTFTGGVDESSFDSVNKYIESLKEVRGALESITTYDADTSFIDAQIDRLIKKAAELEKKERILAGTAGTAATVGVAGTAATPAAPGTGTTSSASVFSTPPANIINNFYGMDRSDAVDVSKESVRQLARA